MNKNGLSAPVTCDRLLCYCQTSVAFLRVIIHVINLKETCQQSNCELKQKKELKKKSPRSCVIFDSRHLWQETRWWCTASLCCKGKIKEERSYKLCVKHEWLCWSLFHLCGIFIKIPNPINFIHSFLFWTHFYKNVNVSGVFKLVFIVLTKIRAISVATMMT